jgi:hypothetical protein
LLLLSDVDRILSLKEVMTKKSLKAIRFPMNGKLASLAEVTKLNDFGLQGG